jgi:hypothetical protein
MINFTVSLTSSILNYSYFTVPHRSDLDPQHCHIGFPSLSSLPCSSWIPDPDLFSISDPGVKKAPDLGSDVKYIIEEP